MTIMGNSWKFVSLHSSTAKRKFICWGIIFFLIGLEKFVSGTIFGNCCIFLAAFTLFFLPQEEVVICLNKIRTL